ncbi:MAG: hypothetical protein QXT84_03165 [Candidatus Bathyarchaeia archaeon]
MSKKKTAALPAPVEEKLIVKPEGTFEEKSDTVLLYPKYELTVIVTGIC